MNWSYLQKCLVLAQIIYLTFVTYASTSIMSPAAQDIMSSFNIDHVAATLTLSLSVMGCAVGVMIWSSVSEIPHIGRTHVLVVPLSISVVLQIPVAMAPNFGTLLAFRFLTGLFGSPALAVGGATVSDLFGSYERSYPLCFWDIAVFAGAGKAIMF